MSKADDVLKYFYLNSADLSGTTFEKVVDEAKQQLLADLLALPELQDGMEIEYGLLGSNKAIELKARNRLRAELRQALRSYFGEENNHDS